MNFSETTPGVYRSDAGFSVRPIMGPCNSMWIVYQSEGQSLRIPAQWFASGVTVSLHYKGSLNLAEYAAILLNIKAVFAYAQEPMTFESPKTEVEHELFRLLGPAKKKRPIFSITKPTLCECAEGFSVEFSPKADSPVLYQSAGKVFRVPCKESRLGLEFPQVGEHRWDTPYENEFVEDYGLILFRIESAIIQMKTEDCWPPAMTWKLFLPRTNVCAARNGRFSIAFVRGPSPVATIFYQEGGKVLRVEVDIQYRGVENYRWNKVWDQPYENEILELHRQNEINSNISAAVDCMIRAGEWPPRFQVTA